MKRSDRIGRHCDQKILSGRAPADEGKSEQHASPVGSNDSVGNGAGALHALSRGLFKCLHELARIVMPTGAIKTPNAKGTRQPQAFKLDWESANARMRPISPPNRLLRFRLASCQLANSTRRSLGAASSRNLVAGPFRRRLLNNDYGMFAD